MTNFTHDEKFYTSKSTLRLECLKLAHSLAKPINEVIDRARVYEEYLFEGIEASAEKAGKKKGKSGNLDSLI